MTLVKRFIKDERGLEGSEYALLLALIAVAIALAVSKLSTAIGDRFDDTTGIIDGTVTPT